MAIKKSAGILIVYKDKILLCKPSSMYGGNNSILSIPKGNIEECETILDAALRETLEEVGIYVDRLIK